MSASRQAYLHGVCGEHDCAARLGLLDDVPHEPAGDGVHACPPTPTPCVRLSSRACYLSWAVLTQWHPNPFRVLTPARLQELAENIVNMSCTPLCTVNARECVSISVWVELEPWQVKPTESTLSSDARRRLAAELVRK